MDPRLRTFLIGLLACGLAAWVGVTLAQEEHLIASFSAGICIWVIFSWTRGPLAEAWLVGFLVFGYVIGNRGFAQLTPISGLPVFFSELGLAVTLIFVLLRGALKRELPFRRDWINSLLLLWLVIATGRIGWDVRRYGLLAVRDFAMVYYVLFFFATQSLASHPPSRRLLQGALLITFAVLPVTGLLAFLFPEFFLHNLLVAGVPLIFYKADLLATFLFTGYVLLLPKDQFTWRDDWWRWLLALTSLVLGLLVLSRASMVGLLVAIGWLALAGRWQPARVLVAVCVSGALAVTGYSLLQKKDFTQTKVYAVYEAVASIGDYSGTHNYQSDTSNEKGDNNRFRLIWWRNVAEETLTTSPLLGLGFGADLAHGFLLEYYPVAEVDFTARSPHSIIMSTLGRMGLVGAAVLLAFYFVQARMTARTARQARQDPALQDAMTLQAAVWVVLVSSCFGVVLEGPMGAIPFWVMLGLAHYLANHPERDAIAEISVPEAKAVLTTNAAQ